MTPGTYIIEHKTTSLDITPGSKYWRKLTLDSQVSNYVSGVRTLGIDPIGVVYDVIRKVTLEPYLATPVESRSYTLQKSKQCPECRKKNGALTAPHMTETGEIDEDGVQYTQCVDGRIITDPGGKLYSNMREHDEPLDEYRQRVRAAIVTDPDHYYQRQTIVRLAEEEREAERDLWLVAAQIRQSKNANAWPRNVDACETYGSQCEYWGVCAGETTIDDPIRYKIVEPTYKHRLPVLSTSAAKCYRSCPRRYLYAYELRARGRTATAALRFGTLFHAALEAWWAHRDHAVEYGLTAIESAKADLQIDPADVIKAEELFFGYAARWADEPMEATHVEAEYLAPLVNPDTGHASTKWMRAGKVDAIANVTNKAQAYTHLPCTQEATL